MANLFRQECYLLILIHFRPSTALNGHIIMEPLHNPEIFASSKKQVHRLTSFVVAAGVGDSSKAIRQREIGPLGRDVIATNTVPSPMQRYRLFF